MNKVLLQLNEKIDTLQQLIEQTFHKAKEAVEAINELIRELG